MSTSVFKICQFIDSDEGCLRAFSRPSSWSILLSRLKKGSCDKEQVKQSNAANDIPDAMIESLRSSYTWLSVQSLWLLEEHFVGETSIIRETTEGVIEARQIPFPWRQSSWDNTRAKEGLDWARSLLQRYVSTKAFLPRRQAGLFFFHDKKMKKICRETKTSSDWDRLTSFLVLS